MTTPQTEPAQPQAPRRRLPFDLSPIQLVATALAAITATFAASYLGLAGTVVGAALASVVTAVGKEVYGTSLRTTGSRVREVVPVTRILPRVTHTTSQSAEDVPTHVDGVPAPGTGAADSDAAGAPVPAGSVAEVPPELPATTPSARPKPTWRKVAVGAVAVFVTVMAVITGIELVAGRPLSDLLRGDQGNGTSFFGGDQPTKTKTVPPTTPTVTQTVIPHVVVTTPTVTQTAPAVTRTNSTAPSSSPAGSKTSTTTTPTSTPTPTKTPTP